MARPYTLSTDISWQQTMEDLAECFRKWGIEEYEALKNVMGSRMNSYALSPSERRATVRYRHPSGQVVELSMERQERPADNLRVLYLALEAMRLNEARGLGDVMAAAYLQLAAPRQRRDPYEVLGVRSDTDKDVIKAAYRALAKKLHPDTGSGDAEAMTELNGAYASIMGEKAE